MDQSSDSDLQHSEWFFPKLTDYLDWETNAIVLNSQKMRKLKSHERSKAFLMIERAIKEHVRVLSDQYLVIAAFVIAEDLYKNITQNFTYWDECLEAYLRSCGRTFFTSLKSRGLRIRYIIDNSYENTPLGLQGPIRWFPKLFATVGVAYICPHHQFFLIHHLDEGEPTPVDHSRLRLLDGKIVELLSHLDKEAENFVYLNASSNEDILTFLLDDQTKSDSSVITILRTEPPVKGSKAIVIHPSLI